MNIQQTIGICLLGMVLAISTPALAENWQVGKAFKEVNLQGYTRSSDRASLNQVTRTLSGTLNKLNTEVDRLDKRIELQEKNIELSHENYQDARSIYGAGTMTLTRMGDFNLLYAEARFNLLHLYYLENLVAMDVTALIHGNHDLSQIQ